jgi:hypothetical protein
MKTAIMVVTMIVAGPARAEAFAVDVSFLGGHTDVRFGRRGGGASVVAMR